MPTDPPGVGKAGAIPYGACGRPPVTPDISELTHELERSRFYGSLELKYEDGRLVLIRRTETFKPPMEKPTGNDLTRNR